MRRHQYRRLTTLTTVVQYQRLMTLMLRSSGAGEEALTGKVTITCKVAGTGKVAMTGLMGRYRSGVRCCWMRTLGCSFSPRIYGTSFLSPFLSSLLFCFTLHPFETRPNSPPFRNVTKFTLSKRDQILSKRDQLNENR